MSLLAVSVFLSESILTSIDGHFELFFGFLKNNYTYLEASDPDEIWQLHDFLNTKRREIDDKYDFRYSMLILVFARLLKEGWIDAQDLEGLREDKITKIKELARV